MSIDLTTVFQVMPYAQNVAHAELVQPDAQLAASQLLAQQALAEQNKQTSRIEQQEAMDSVTEDRQRQPSGQQHAGSRRKHQPEEEETQTGNSTPFAGHIINVKI